MRALRVYHWMLNPSFYEQIIGESNYPFGEIIHWTRPMDILWLINLLPFLFMDNLKDIIFISGAFISPWLAVITSLILIYGLRRQFNIYLTIYGGFLFLCNSTMQNYFSPSRPDHHSLMICLSTYAFSLVLCWLKKRHNRYLIFLGIALALMLMTALEGIIVYALFIAFFLILYVFKNFSLLPAVKTAKYFAFALVVCWLFNPPLQGWFYPDNGRISILFVVLGWLVFIMLYGLDLSHLHTKTVKLCGIILAGIGCVLVLLLIWRSNIYYFPLNNEINTIWGKRIAEMRAIWNMSFGDILAYYTFSFTALVLSLILFKIKSYQCLMIFNVCLGLPLFVLSLIACRFISYQHLFTFVPFLCFIDFVYKKSEFYKQKSGDFPVNIWVICIFILLLQQMLVLPGVLKFYEIPRKRNYSAVICQNVRSIGGTLVTDVFRSVEYVWKCGVTTVGTPYHRNQEGIIDNHNILYETDDTRLITLLLKHQVKQILLFEDKNNYYDMSVENKNKLYYRLIKQENVPSFMEKVPNYDKGIFHYQLKL